jgi:hypothetical protein
VAPFPVVPVMRANVSLSLHLEGPTVAFGSDFSGSVTLFNKGPSPFGADIGQPLRAVLVRFGSDRVAGVYGGDIVGTGLLVELAPRRSETICVVGGTARCDGGTGSALPHGLCGVTVLVRDEGANLSARAPSLSARRVGTAVLALPVAPARAPAKPAVLRVVTVSTEGAILSARALAPPVGCSVASALFSPRATVIADMACGARESLVELSPRTGRVLRTLVAVARGHALLLGPIDESGKCAHVRHCSADIAGAIGGSLVRPFGRALHEVESTPARHARGEMRPLRSLGAPLARKR